ncbi:MAG: hypothetical protein DMF75_18350, partial [Acidobacteria bacterium]
AMILISTGCCGLLCAWVWKQNNVSRAGKGKVSRLPLPNDNESIFAIKSFSKLQSRGNIRDLWEIAHLNLPSNRMRI